MPERVKYQELAKEAQKMPAWQKNRYFLMVGAALGIALFMVMIAMNLYSSSGTAQLDLSRPDYESVRAQTTTREGVAEFSSTGEITLRVLQDFEKQFQRSANDVIKADAFRADALSDRSLNLPIIVKTNDN